MKLLEAIKKVKALLGAVKLTQTQLSDKSLIQFDGDEIEKSSVVYLIDAAGNLSVLPDGIYQTQDGLKFTVQFGTVTNVDDSKAAPTKEDTPVLQAQSKAKAPVAPAAEPAPKAETPADTDDSEDDSEEDEDDDEDENPDADADAKQTQALIDAALAPIVAQIQAIQEAISQSTEMTKKTQTALSAISDAVAVISKEPAAKPIEKEVNPFKKVSEDEKETRLYKILHS